MCLALKTFLLSIFLLCDFSCANAGEPPSAVLADGYTLLTHKSYTRAIPVLVKALRINPRDVGARRYLAYAFHKIGMSTIAAKQMEIVICSDPGNANDRAAVGVMYLLSGESLRAIEAFKHCLVIDACHEQARYGLARAYLSAGDSVHANSVCMDALRGRGREKMRKPYLQILNYTRTSIRTVDARG